MDSRKSVGAYFTSHTREELEDELYSEELDDESDDLFDADELGLDPEEDDEYYAATDLLAELSRKSAGPSADHWMAI